MRAWTGLLLLVFASPATAAHEPVVGGPCENCEAVFEGMPGTLTARTRLGTPSEPGEPLLVAGRVHDASGKAVAGAIVYAYHTNAKGIYPTRGQPTGRGANRHGLLRGWARTDAQGRYSFDTIRPVGYPGTDIPQHIHMHVIEPGRCTYWIDDILFRDDPRLDAGKIRQFDHGRGGSGIAMPTRGKGAWNIRRDIELGHNIPDYERCGAAAK